LLTQIGADPLAPAHGGFAPSIRVGPGRIMRADAALSDVEAAQIEPATVTYHAVARSGLRLGDVVVVQGGGPIGLTALQWARAGGAGHTVVIEPSPHRQELARSLGADAVVAPGAEADALVQERTKGLGADVVYECVGRADTVQSAVDLVRRGGSMCLIGLAGGDVPITPTTWLIKEVRVTAALAYLHHEFETVMGMVADGRVQLEPLHDATIGLEQLDATMADLADGRSAFTKILVDPRA
jgi:(R,R)-butanediol dehydrogenase/meso-butanediol dehydrogenase/diacetyl reductase